MRFRIYKRKVFILTLVVAACGLAFWNNGRQKKNEVFVQDSDMGRSGRSSVSAGIRRLSNETLGDKVPKPDVDNTTLVYRSIVYQLNFDQTIKNLDTIEPRPQDDLVVVVQVHNRPEYLKLLIESLRKAKNIENVLLIFSHDFWSSEINTLISKVDFCQVLQIFFPFSIQLYPNEFPGNDPKDCPRDIEKSAAVKLGCINAEYPDSFGHYREAKFSQTKHHWWWKLHFVWERVKVLKDYNGLVMFIEEDHYLSPDFYHVLKNMWSKRNEVCADCDVLTLGSYTRVLAFSGKADKVEVKTWKSTEHNMGMALNRETYQKLIQCTDRFCTYDDYNWDWTLQYLTVTCLPKFWKVMVPEVPRVYHAGDCGMHHKKSCRPSTESAKIESLLNSNQQYMFPENMSISNRYSMAAHSPHVKNGGWGDIRDHELCKSYRKLQ
ncbi:alpha-1,6-mannosyl-glycoprotein 2-beta-N-acetylglucosaminyltransferase [Rhinatrema bivittatum]|uniref:alpha-1,6-mannosyl-glycoprotein 2-beta-N-acetylglucosaminyltransferase n=1 Tax=Rhinatrema bivittatum TaxID=194408 RepID=UPI00112744DB|nr:alpha-1,6-mannosyl-glycoprotein 2-beta-N-acetylglucosaminyltransferase [Rhinatrema bivittatum]XP_029454244.1 alpha-1,6-mannosyl-glycoprotein 2-beta-N-acetylglucosaminyltransferase [Rhinatrema bivittatum]XP_029454245.1 alpha-1,6-mannosyl-glycoprotein 2-beta-N-acetylglucosaminyltransferase [Rhinatrema bivittatum]